jgi:hypothetical protein
LREVVGLVTALAIAACAPVPVGKGRSPDPRARCTVHEYDPNTYLVAGAGAGATAAAGVLAWTLVTSDERHDIAALVGLVVAGIVAGYGVIEYVDHGACREALDKVKTLEVVSVTDPAVLSCAATCRTRGMGCSSRCPFGAAYALFGRPHPSRGSAPFDVSLVDASCDAILPSEASSAGLTHGRAYLGCCCDHDYTSLVTSSPERLDRTSVEEGISRLRPEVLRCHDEHKVAGTATVRLVIAPEGLVETATVTGELAGTPTASCIEAAVLRATFATARAPTTVSYPFVLGGGGAAPPEVP